MMNRGRRSETIYFTDADRKTFLGVLQEVSALWNMRNSAYCLMPNHYHLLVQTPDGNLSRCMRHLNGVYTQRFNHHNNKEGQLFRGRYKAVLVDADSHLLEVLRYIHRNPLKAGIVKHIDDYPWSSHRGYLSQARKWSWLHKDTLLSQLSGKKSRQKSAYLSFVTMDDSTEIEKFYSLKNLPTILGGISFKDAIRERFSGLANRPEIPESRILAPEAETVISCICEHYMISREVMLVSKRGTENLPRDIAIYLVRQLCGKTLPDVGRDFGITNYSSVSSVVQRIGVRYRQNKILKKEIEIVMNKINKSQKRT